MGVKGDISAAALDNGEALQYNVENKITGELVLAG